FVLTFDRPKVADTATDVSTDAFRDVIAYLQSAIGYCFLRSGNRVLNESAHLARFLLLDIVQRIEVLDFAGEPHRKLLGVKFFDVIRAVPACLERGPGSFDRVSNWRDQTKASNNYATLQNEILHLKMQGQG